MTAKKTEPKRKPLTVTCLLDLLERSTVQDFHSLGEEPMFARELREKVEGLLKEIEKEFLKICKGRDIDTVAFFTGLEARIIRKIKKTFEGVLNDC